MGALQGNQDSQNSQYPDQQVHFSSVDQAGEEHQRHRTREQIEPFTQHPTVPEKGWSKINGNVARPAGIRRQHWHEPSSDNDVKHTENPQQRKAPRRQDESLFGHSDISSKTLRP